MSKPDDKPTWGPVARLLTQFRMQFCGWPAAVSRFNIPGHGTLAILTPVTSAMGRPTHVHEARCVSANDENFHPAPEAA